MRQSKITILFGAVVYCALAIGAASAGTIQGSIRYVGPPVERKKLPVTIDHYVCGKEESEELVLSPTNGIRNAVESLQGVPPGIKWPADPAPVNMDQQQCVFVPRVVVVPAGGTVEFLNSDRLLHNVRSDGKANAPFNRAPGRLPSRSRLPSLVSWGKVESEFAYASYDALRNLFNADGDISAEGLKLVIDQTRRTAKVSREVSPSEIVDLTFLRQAQAELGIKGR